MSTPQRMYAAYNDAGVLLIYTSDSYMASFVHEASKGVDTTLRLRVGGDDRYEAPIKGIFRRYVQK